MNTAHEHPLVILGGGREAIQDFQIGEVDDSVLDSAVGGVLRKFLPALFPGKYEHGREPEMEWVRKTVEQCVLYGMLTRFARLGLWASR